MDKTPLFKAVQIAGGQTRLAKQIGVSQGHLWCWLYRDKNIPAKRVPAIEAATNGQITRYQLLPDVFGPDPSAAPPTRRADDRPAPEDRAA